MHTQKITYAEKFFSVTTCQKTQMALPLILGQKEDGTACILDLTKAPHMLLTGMQGSGVTAYMRLIVKSMCQCISPEEVKFLLIDPTQQDFTSYIQPQSLIAPVASSPNAIINTLQWACNELQKRYQQIAAAKVPSIAQFNARPTTDHPLTDSQEAPLPAKLPYLIILISALPNMMRYAPQAFLESLTPLLQKGRAAGIHVIACTVTPNDTILPGFLKTNFPVRLALRVADKQASQSILNQGGAELLPPYSALLFQP